MEGRSNDDVPPGREPAVTARGPARWARAAWRKLRAWQAGPGARRLGRAGQRAGRFGYVAKGALYVVIGALAADAAIRPYDPLGGASGAVRFIYGQPLGQLVVCAWAAALFGYVFWMLVQAGLDPLGRGRALGGAAFRGACLATGALYGVLAWQAVRLVWGERIEARDEQTAAAWLREVLERPGGRWVVGAAACGVLAYGISQLVKAVRCRPSRAMNLSGLRPAARTRVVVIRSAGLAARGLVTGLLGWFVLRAALSLDPRHLRNLGGVLEAVRDQPHGPTLLALLAAGLAAYGVLQWLRAAYWNAPDR